MVPVFIRSQRTRAYLLGVGAMPVQHPLVQQVQLRPVGICFTEDQRWVTTVVEDLVPLLDEARMDELRAAKIPVELLLEGITTNTGPGAEDQGQDKTASAVGGGLGRVGDGGAGGAGGGGSGSATKT